MSTFLNKINARSNYGRIDSMLYNIINNKKYEYNNEFITTKLENKNIIDIVVIAFNNFEVIKYQYYLMKKYFKDDYSYTIMDNSTKEDISNKILDFCNLNKIPYAKLKKVKLKNKPSESHAIALNFVYKNYLKPRNANYIGFLDHDIFPTANYYVKDILDEQLLFGKLQDYAEIKYLWPGFTFLNKKIIKKIDFMTYWKFNGDTGASNYKLIYKKILESNKELKFANFYKVNLLGGDDLQNDLYTIIDKTWIHLINAGQWKKTKDFNLKQEKIFKMLDSKLQEKN